MVEYIDIRNDLYTCMFMYVCVIWIDSHHILMTTAHIKDANREKE